MVVPGRGPELKTEPQALLTLLQVQEADLKMARLLARRDALPEAARAKELAAAAAAARDAATQRRMEASDLQREVRKLEEEIDKVRQRAKRDADIMQSGSVASPKQLMDLQHEIASLQRRQSDLEDAELELLERAEAADAAQTAAEVQRDALAQEAQQAKADADAAMSALGGEFRLTKTDRAALAATVPTDVLRLYDTIRASCGGIGAAEFNGDRCGSCQLTMIPADLAAVKTAPVDEVVRCEECTRILVRTAMLRG